GAPWAARGVAVVQRPPAADAGDRARGWLRDAGRLRTGAAGGGLPGDRGRPGSPGGVGLPADRVRAVRTPPPGGLCGGVAVAAPWGRPGCGLVPAESTAGARWGCGGFGICLGAVRRADGPMVLRPPDPTCPRNRARLAARAPAAVVGLRTALGRLPSGLGHRAWPAPRQDNPARAGRAIHP